MIVFKKTKHIWPVSGEYMRTTKDDVPSAIIACPDCGERGSLRDSHSIGNDGRVGPSIVCDCGFHDFAILEDWQS